MSQIEVEEEEVEEEVEEEEEEIEEEEVMDEKDGEEEVVKEEGEEGVVVKKRGPPKKRRPSSNRFQKIPNYDTHLRRSRKPVPEGEEPKKKRPKLRAGTKAGRESRYLQEVATSGTFFSIQPVKRVMRQVLSECARELQIAAEEWEQLSETTGKKYATPLNKGVDKWRMSSEAVQKTMAGAQRFLDRLAEYSHDIHEARKSVTVTSEDVKLAYKFISPI